jgi:hypothetical protein
MTGWAPKGMDLKVLGINASTGPTTSFAHIFQKLFFFDGF